jgi:hypothetical protein
MFTCPAGEDFMEALPVFRTGRNINVTSLSFRELNRLHRTRWLSISAKVARTW